MTTIIYHCILNTSCLTGTVHQDYKTTSHGTSRSQRRAPLRSSQQGGLGEHLPTRACVPANQLDLARLFFSTHLAAGATDQKKQQMRPAHGPTKPTKPTYHPNHSAVQAHLFMPFKVCHGADLVGTCSNACFGALRRRWLMEVPTAWNPPDPVPSIYWCSRRPSRKSKC